MSGTLYLQHFGLTEPPFRLTPDIACFFTGAERGRTLQALLYAVSEGDGIIRITGEVGAGKTMLCRMLLDQLPDSVDILYLAVPNLSRREVLHALSRELGLPADTPDDAVDLLARLQDELIERHAEGFRVAVLIDEAHTMPVEALEQIRLLSNLESRNAPLLQIVLFGQPELDRLLDQPAMRALRDRIKYSFTLGPMKLDEVAAYIDVRLRAAGYAGGPLFRPSSLRTLARAAGGMARRVNILADRSLLAAFAEGSRTVDPRHVMLAVRDGRYLPWYRTAFAWQVLFGGLAAGVLVGLVLAWILIKVRSP